MTPHHFLTGTLALGMACACALVAHWAPLHTVQTRVVECGAYDVYYVPHDAPSVDDAREGAWAQAKACSGALALRRH